jgi:TRAP transporter TAXI family solute receptor
LKKLLGLLVIAAFAVMAITGCGGGANKNSQPRTASKEPVLITIVTGGSSGPYFALGGAVAKLFNENIPGAKASVQSTGASAVNCTLLGEKKAELAFAMNDVVSYAYTGTEVFKDKGAVKNLRGMAALYPNYVQLIALEKSGIKSVADLKGKRVGVGAPGSGTEVNARQVLEAYGITYKDIKPDYLSYAESIEQMKNGSVDAAFQTSGLPNSTILDLCTTHDVRIIPIEPKTVEKLAEKYPFYTSVSIPGGTYDNKEDVPTAAVTSILVVRDDMPEDLVYNMTKIVFENLGDLVSTHSAAKDIKLEKAKKGIPVPLHPGAEKYFKEKGVN